MKFFKNKIYKVCLAMGVMLPAFSSCTDDLKLIEPNGGQEEVEGDCISFMMRLDKNLSTRDESGISFSTSGSNGVSDYEDYIDTQDKFRVFFFTKQGDFLFGATDRVVGSYATNDNSSDYWYVRIPMTKIVDREGQEYDIDKIKNYLKNNPFKIAVLANWPNGGEKVNPADYDDSEGTQSSGDNPSSELKGNPKWNWSNSILNKDANPSDIRNINDLHHVYHDTYYSDNTLSSVEGASTRLATYGNFMAHVTSGDDAGYYMGEPTDWVKMRDIKEPGAWKANYDLDENVPEFSGKTSANRWIRANWTPEVKINQDKGIYRHYQHLWFLWNFDAAFKYGEWLKEKGYDAAINDEDTDEIKAEKKEKADDIYGSNWDWNDNTQANLANPRGIEWYTRNGETLYNWMEKSYNNGGEARPIGNSKIEVVDSKNDFEVFFEYLSKNGSPCYVVKVGDNYGLHLPNIGAAKIENGSTGMIKFQARTSGTLRVKWSSRYGQAASLAVQKGYTSESKQYVHSNYRSTTPTDWTYEGLGYIDVTVEGNTEPLYIYCTEGNAVVYAVEFIRGRYLYETDREGVAPSKIQGIPMYGVQDFKSIGDWQRGTTFNLPSNISLIRALAKVEVYIPTKFKQPKHVYMRNMNRLARCEPMNVHSKTDKIWTDKHNAQKPEDDNCEWFRIQEYGPSYGTKLNSNTYPDWLSWFYGSWQTAAYDDPDESIYWKQQGDQVNYVYNRDKGYFMPNGTLKGWKEENPFNYSEYANGQKPPHVFNPYYYQNDFCRMLFAGEDNNGNYKYVLYMPEKNIDDPSIIGKMDSNPRVPHIEYRFAPIALNDEIMGTADDYNNTEYNLDDNDCYRIYFTNYGKSKTGGDLLPRENSNILNVTNRDNYDAYEKNEQNLRFHWPIMRNHVYRFYIEGDGPENPEIHVQVTDWGHKKVVLEW